MYSPSLLVFMSGLDSEKALVVFIGLKFLGGMRLGNVVKKRRKKIRKHKYKKLRKRTRALRNK